MDNLNEQKLKLLESIGKLTGAIDEEVDWLIASFSEKDRKRRLLARIFFVEKQIQRVRLAKEVYEQFK